MKQTYKKKNYLTNDYEEVSDETQYISSSQVKTP